MDMERGDSWEQTGYARGVTFAAMKSSVTEQGYPVAYSDKLSYSMVFYVKIG
ncbi:hypothetical protein KDW_48890 [Dictyobacter vulcani]|uniref:Uncharacterized protein n=1 Tax=Dictyobacter vulcani TaxID=2607529 RepID=A0A5J4KW12_9CHLR|nr:hypothetical protein KDW_48890 [Dictyobacter vulcani]